MSLLDTMCTPKTHAAVSGRTNDVVRPTGMTDAWLRPSRVMCRSINGHRWHIREDSVGILDHVPLDACYDLMQVPGAVLIKENDGRQVWEIRLPTGNVFAKVSFVDDFKARLKRWLRGPVCLREWRVADYAKRFGLPTVQPIACAYPRSRWGGARSLLVTAALPGAVPLNRYWSELANIGDATRRYRQCDRLISVVAELIARAHQCGFRHVDLHAGNLLVVRDPQDETRLRVVFVDLHGVRIGRAVSDSGVIRNLAQLNQWFRRHATLTQRLRFLRRYLDARARGENDPVCNSLARRLGLEFKALVAALDRRARQHAREISLQRDRRILRDNKYFARIRLSDGWRGHVFLRAKHPVAGSRASVTVFERAQWEAWLREPLAWVRPEQAWHMLKDSHSAVVCMRALPVEPQPLMVVCKRSLPRNIGRRLAGLVRQSRNRRTWRLGYALIHRDIPTARPLAVLERRRFGLLLDSMVITEALTGSRDLDAVIAMELTRLPPRRQYAAKSLLSDAILRLVGMMHERGFTHRDFKASNVMIEWDPGFSTTPRLSLVDLDGLALRSRWLPVTMSRVYRAMARLNVSLDHCTAITLADRARFLKRWLAVGGRGTQADWKLLWRDLDARSQSLRRQYERHQSWKLRHYGRT